MSISTGPVIPLSCILITIRDTAVSFALFHWWFISGFNTWLITWLNRIQWRWDHWVHEQKLIQHQMSYFPEHLSKLRAHRVCSEQLFDAGKRLLPEFQNKSLAGNFGPHIWLSDGHFGQFRAIGPMELLRPAQDAGDEQVCNYLNICFCIVAWDTRSQTSCNSIETTVPHIHCVYFAL